MDFGREAIKGVERLIRRHVRRTPALDVFPGDFGLAVERLNFKLELMQHSGSFKARGAFANLLTREVPTTGVVAARSRVRYDVLIAQFANCSLTQFICAY